MKVIKENKFNNLFPMKITCKSVSDQYGFSYGDDVDFCGSELEIEAEDIKMHKWSKYPDYEGTDYGVRCPICGQFIVIDEKKLPNMILKTAEEIRLGDMK